MKYYVAFLSEYDTGWSIYKHIPFNTIDEAKKYIDDQLNGDDILEKMIISIHDNKGLIDDLNG